MSPISFHSRRQLPADARRSTASPTSRSPNSTATASSAGMRMLDERQIDALRDELAELVHAEHDGRELWYEYHTNESSDPDTVLFHALGAWRIRPACTTSCGTRRSWCRRRSSRTGRCGSGTTSSSASRPSTAASWRGTRTIPTGRAPMPMAHLTCWIGLDDSTDRKRLRPLHPRLAPLAAAADDACWPAAWRRSRRFSRPSSATQFQARRVRAEGGRGGVPPPADAARQLREPQPPAAAGGGDQRLPRRHAERQRRAAAWSGSMRSPAAKR